MRLALSLVLAALLVAPAPVAAQIDSDLLPPAQPAPTQTAAPVSDDSSEDDVGRRTLYVLGGALIVGFVVIGFWITRDARRNVGDHDRDERPKLREEGPHRHKRQAKAKARAKGRAQRAARRSNR